MPISPRYIPTDDRYTTLDEINYLRDLAKRGKLNLLRAALTMLPNRRWYGEGMEVDPGLVKVALVEMIEELEGLGFGGGVDVAGGRRVQ